MANKRLLGYLALATFALFALWLTHDQFLRYEVATNSDAPQELAPELPSTKHPAPTEEKPKSSTDEDRPNSKPPIPNLSNDFPKKVWQSWKDDSEDPTDRTKGFPRQWRTVNPDWDYERITDGTIDEFVTSRFQDPISTVFTQLDDTILKADFLRYLILLREGGVWADIDVKPHQPVSEWIPKKFRDKEINLVIGIENDHHKRPIWPGNPYSVQLCQYTVLAKPNHTAIRNLVDQVAQDLESLLDAKNPGEAVSFAEVMGTTGPFAFTKALMDYFTAQTGVKHTGDELDRLPEPKLIGDVLVLPKDSFGWLPQEHDLEKGDPLILVEHLFIGSWREGHPG